MIVASEVLETVMTFFVTSESMGSVSDPMVSCSSFGGSVASIVFGSAYHGCSVSSTVACSGFYLVGGAGGKLLPQISTFSPKTL